MFSDHRNRRKKTQAFVMCNPGVAAQAGDGRKIWGISSGILLMGGAVFPPCCWTWDQTMVEVMKVIATSCKRSYALTATLGAPDSAIGHHRPTPPLETSGHSQASLGQSLVGSLLLSPGSWCTQGFVCALQETVAPALYNFCNQIPPASKVKFSESSQSLCHIPRLRNLLWVLELS